MATSVFNTATRQQNSSGTPLVCHVTARHGLMIQIMPFVDHIWRAYVDFKWHYSTTSAVKFMWSTCGPHVAIVSCHDQERRKVLVMLHCGTLFDIDCLNLKSTHFVLSPVWSLFSVQWIPI